MVSSDDASDWWTTLRLVYLKSETNETRQLKTVFNLLKDEPLLYAGSRNLTNKRRFEVASRFLPFPLSLSFLFSDLGKTEFENFPQNLDSFSSKFNVAFEFYSPICYRLLHKLQCSPPFREVEPYSAQKFWTTEFQLSFNKI